jgi:hypothetical protein
MRLLPMLKLVTAGSLLLKKLKLWRITRRRGAITPP